MQQDSPADKLRIKEYPKAYVLDSSIFVKWFSRDGEDDMDKALLLFKSTVDNTIVVVSPELAIYELASTLYFKPGFDARKVKEVLSYFLDIGIEFITLDLNLIIEANFIRYDYTISFYDSIYLSVADFYGLKFITADKKLFDACSSMKNIDLLKNLK